MCVCVSVCVCVCVWLCVLGGRRDCKIGLSNPLDWRSSCNLSVLIKTMMHKIRSKTPGVVRRRFELADRFISLALKQNLFLPLSLSLSLSFAMARCFI